VTVFLDVSALVFAVTGGPRRDACRSLLLEIASGEIAATTSTRVIEELWLSESIANGGLPRGTSADAFEIFPGVLSVDEWVLQTAFSLSGPPEASPTHLIHVATCRAHRLDAIVSADSVYDGFGWLQRIEPDSGGLNQLRSMR
jgi:predicted nucleic acid-binding protein